MRVRVRVCVCVRVSVCYHYSGTTGYEAAKERYQRPERYVGIVLKKVISESYGVKHASEEANMLMSTGLPRCCSDL